MSVRKGKKQGRQSLQNTNRLWDLDGDKKEHIMSNKLFTLRDIFKDRIFRIPDFQRGYSWNKSQL